MRSGWQDCSEGLDCNPAAFTFALGPDRHLSPFGDGPKLSFEQPRASGQHLPRLFLRQTAFLDDLADLPSHPPTPRRRSAIRICLRFCRMSCRRWPARLPHPPGMRRSDRCAPVPRNRESGPLDTSHLPKQKCGCPSQTPQEARGLRHRRAADLGEQVRTTNYTNYTCYWH